MEFKSLADFLMECSTDKGISFIEKDGSEIFCPYGELVATSLRRLGHLQALGIKPGQEVVFQLERNQDFVELFWTCQLGGFIPVPLSVGHVDDHKRKLLKVWSCLKDPVLISTAKSITQITQSTKSGEVLEQIDNLCSKAIIWDEYPVGPPGIPYIWTPGETALIQFSSGSTGDPKGVVLTQENLVSNTKALIHSFHSVTGEERMISWMPLTHDMGLICLHLTPVVANWDQFSMSTEVFIRNPSLWLKKISQNRLTISGSPNFGYQFLMKHNRIKEEDNLDLSSLRIIINGAEPISAELCKEFIGTFHGYGLRENVIVPAYGLAEASVAVALALPDDPIEEIIVDRKTLNIGSRIREISPAEQGLSCVVCGFPVQDCHIRICDDYDHVLEEGLNGHIQISGKNVTSGYYGKPEVTKEVLCEEWIKTGDTGFLSSGRIVITGRAKEMIILKGQNYYPHDIEGVLAGLEGCGLGKVIAQSVKRSSDIEEKLIVFILFKKNMEGFLPIAESVNSLLLESYGFKADEIVPILKVPKTTSGKIQRKRIIQNYLAGQYDAQRGQLSKVIQSKENNLHICPENALDIEVENLFKDFFSLPDRALSANLWDMGIDSLLIMNFAEVIKTQFKVELSIPDLLSCRSITDISYLIRNSRDLNHKVYPDIKAGTASNKDFPLTKIQRAYLMGREKKFLMGGVSTHAYYEVETKLDISRLEGALNQLIQRHETLRTIIHPEGRQSVLSEVPRYHIEIASWSPDVILEKREAYSHYIFPSHRWPLFSIEGLRKDKETTLLIIHFDLLILDGSSFGLFIKEWLELYHSPGKKLPPLEFSFADYLLGLEEVEKGGLYGRDKSYWLGRLLVEPQYPKLPMINSPEELTTPWFKRLCRTIKISDLNDLQNVCRIRGISLSSFLCSAYSYLLSYWTNRESVPINLTLFNRYPFHKEVNQILGDFTTTLILDMFWTKSFEDSLADQQRLLFEALEHRHYDGVEFARESSSKSGDHQGLVPYVFTSMLFPSDREWQFLDSLGKIEYGISQTPQVFIDCQVMKVKEGLSITWDYVADLFDKDWMDKLFSDYINIIHHFTHHEKIPKAFLSPEARSLWECYNETERFFPESNLVSLFKKAVMQYPKNIALIHGDNKITYSQLDYWSDNIALELLSQGLKRGEFVCLSASRSMATIANLLGILKAGGAYIPMEDSYPEQRKQFIKSNSSSRFYLDSDSGNTLKTENKPKLPHIQIDPKQVAYTIYTSGSTGSPKGVVITHQAVTNTIQDINSMVELGETDQVLGLSSLCFDLSVYDVFGTLSSGAALVLIDDLRDLQGIKNTIVDNKISLWNSVPAILDMYIDQERFDPSPLEGCQFLLSGDWIPLNLPEKVWSNYPGSKVISLGGATEGSIWSIYYQVKRVHPDWNSIPYGFPLGNQQIYVLNSQGELCPPEVVGELYIGGIGVAKEYLQDREKTENAFLNHHSLGRIYKTGDYGVLKSTGYIEFLGRRDNQVKIRGYRVETGEIEKNLLTIPELEKTVVVAKEGYDKKKYLCAYYIPNNPIESDKIREILSEKLPEYLIPSQFIEVEYFPTNRNGKVDTSKLPLIDLGYEVDFSDDWNDFENEMKNLWLELLGEVSLSRQSHFYDFGGDSIKIVSLLREIESRWKVKLSFSDVFHNLKFEDICKLTQENMKEKWEIKNA